jgi:hypothetical protein
MTSAAPIRSEAYAALFLLADASSEDEAQAARGRALRNPVSAPFVWALDDPDLSVAVAAANMILDRLEGKPRERVEVRVDWPAAWRFVAGVAGDPEESGGE